MRQARAAMRSGAASSRDAARQALATANPKWQPGLSPLEEEEKLKVIVPTSAQQVRQINRMIDTLLDANDLDPDVRKALALWKTNYQMESVPDQVRRAFLEGFWCWLLGRGTDEDTRRTLWGRGNVAAHNREVAAYLELFARKRTEYAARLVLMAEHVPDTLNGFYLYYKYIVKGALKKVQDPSDPSKWFYSLEDEQFLEDWDLFEQEGGNYAHMIEPAAKRGADKQPWGGDEPNTSAMDPYPATPSDRKLEACMDNLTHQIAQLNQSLSISHVDLGATALIKTQSASYRNKTQTDAGTLAGAGNDMSTVTHTVGVDDAKEIDIDGGDGRDEEAEQALEEEEKPSEVNQLNESMREMVVVMRDLLAAEQRRFEEQEQRRKDELAAATAVPVPDTPELELQKAREEFARMQSEEFRESMANATDTPQSPAAGAVESPPGTTPRPEGFETPSMSQVLQDVAHAYDKELAELKAELEREVAAAEKAPLKRDVPVARKALIGGINAQYQALLDDVIHRRAQAIEAARQSLAAQAPVIAGLHSPNTARQLDFSSLSDLHSPSTMAAIETAAAPEQLLEASAAVADANPQAAVALADAAVAVEKAKLAAVKEAAAAQKRVHFENQ